MYAHTLEGKTLRDFPIRGVRERARSRHKGDFGNLVESIVFGVNPNNVDEPDLAEANIEIKTSPLIQRKRAGLVPKERLVLGMIDFAAIISEEFESSKFLRKNGLLLVLFYRWHAASDAFDYAFERALRQEFEGEDLRIIRRDWEKIRDKVSLGQAHEISEGDTLYLGACTKGASRLDQVRQPRSDIPAMRRAFALKTSYLRTIRARSAKVEPIPGLESSLDFEAAVLRRLAEFEGKAEQELIASLLEGKGKKAKHRLRLLINRMLRVRANAVVEQFEKADLQVKTVRVESNGSIVESMSFRNIDFFEVNRVDEWEDSEFFDDITRRFLFCVFRRDPATGELRFARAFFWRMPPKDLDEAGRVWRMTKARARKGNYGALPGKSESVVAHVRTKGRDSADLVGVPNGKPITKRCFWLNNTYVAAVISNLGGESGDWQARTSGRT
jgi:DNA mismatch repair protein MutH